MIHLDEYLLLKSKLFEFGLPGDFCHNTGQYPFNIKRMISARSGSSSGMDICVSNCIYINVGVGGFQNDLSISFDIDKSCFICVEGSKTFDVSIIREPMYYSTCTSAGIPMHRIGQMCSADRLCISLENNCCFNKGEKKCCFCGIGNGSETEEKIKHISDIVETVEAAVSDPILPARHIMLGGGTLHGEDRGIPRFAEVASRIREKVSVPIYVMVPPPRDLSLLQLLKDAGVDELGMNIEFMDSDYLRRFAPGKFEIGFSKYFKALEAAVEIFGPVNARSIMLCGIEPIKSTLAGVRELASRGVMPILSPFRPQPGSPMEQHPACAAENSIRLFHEASAICDNFSIPLGPTCIPCQNNTIALPFGKHYRYY